MPHAVAVDLGASSGRIALGELIDGRINFKIVEQIAHSAVEERGRLVWDLDLLLHLCLRARDLAATFKDCSLGIDSWGVDHGFLDQDGVLIGSPVCYRDLSHLTAFESLRPHRERLYELTGIQHQPFNTICQLVARRTENPGIVREAGDWLILPDLLGYLLGGKRRSEVTQCSTTQLMDLSGEWSEEAFSIAGWPVPKRPPTLSGQIVGRLDGGVDLVTVGSHDTASAVFGFGGLATTDMFLNVGTWSLAGVLVDQPITSKEAENSGFTNERAVDGRVRFLKNIPGFYFINRLHDELGIQVSVPEWLKSSESAEELIDLSNPKFFNPDSMLEICRAHLSKIPSRSEEWAGIALQSLASEVSRAGTELSKLTGQDLLRVRVGGGGSLSKEFCTALSKIMGVEVSAGPSECTVLGNLAAQFVAQGVLKDWEHASETVSRSFQLATSMPEGFAI